MSKSEKKEKKWKTKQNEHVFTLEQEESDGEEEGDGELLGHEGLGDDDDAAQLQGSSTCSSVDVKWNWATVSFSTTILPSSGE